MYRSGRNEADSKSVDGQPSGGSNPSISAKKALETLSFQGFSFFLNGSGICLILKMVPMVPGFVVPRQFGLCTKNECCGAGMVPIAPAASYKSEYKHKDALNDLRERPSAYSMLITEFKSKSFWW